jgi:HlyD family secretion protein
VSSRAVTGPTSVLALVRQILVKAGLSAVEGLRPWLRREAWTARGLKEALSGISAHPWKAWAFLALGGAALFYFHFFFGADGLGGMPTGLVREGPFRVTITEIGTLQPLRSVTYASTIQSNQAKIVALAPEGKMVEKKDLLILFDSTPFEEEIRRNQALLSEAEADLQKAKEDLKLQRIQNEEDIAASKQKMEQTDLELKDVQQGKGRLKEEEADNAVNDAQRELQKALAAASDLKPLLAEGFITKLELERAEQQVQKARGELALAEQRREALVNFSRPLELSQARSDALLTKESVRQLQAAADYRLEQKKAAIAAAQSRSQEAASKLAQARQQLARTEVRADVPGIVVYRDVFFGSEQRKPQVGDQVWANQPLLILPDISKMVVETKIRETDIHKVERNQKVVIRTEAYPDLKLSGAVTLVGTLAQEEKERRGTRFLGVTIQVNESETRLRPGMTARVEIEVETRPRALFVPLEAVFERDGRSLCYVVEHRRIVPREVVLGPSNQNFVVIEDGLRKGARVCLRDPAAPASDFGSAATP